MGWRGTGLQLAEDDAFQRREWTSERIAWSCFAAVIVAALTGVFGHGPVSWAEARTASGDLVVQYERFNRHLGESSLTASIQPDGASTVTLVVSTDYLENNEVQVVSPQPKDAVLTDRGVAYVFDVARPDRPVQVQFHSKPDRIGLHRSTFGVPGAEPLELRQLTYP